MNPGEQYGEVCYSGTPDQWPNFVNPGTGCGAVLNPNYVEPAAEPYIVECLFGTPGPTLMSDGTTQYTDYCYRYQPHFTLGSDISTRDRDGIHKTFSGLMKLIYPSGEATQAEIEELLRFAIEGRKRVKDQILRIDTTMAAVKFGYTDKAGAWHNVTTLEEDEYPEYYQARRPETEHEAELSAEPESAQVEDTVAVPSVTEVTAALFEGHREFQENQRGISYETLLMPYLRGATDITIIDPYIRLPHQGHNLVDLLALLAAAKDPADEIAVTLVTKEDRGEYAQQHLLMLKDIQDSAATVGIQFDVI